MADLNNLIGDIYEASLEPSRWDSVLDDLNSMFDSRHATMVYHDRLNQRRVSYWLRSETSASKEEDDDVRYRYVHEYLSQDMASARLHVDGIPDGFAFAVQLHPSMPGFEDPEYWRFTEDVLRTHFRLASKLMKTEHSIAMTAVNREKHKPAFSTDEVNLYGQITQHIARAFRIHHQLSAARTHGEKLLETLKHLTHGVLLLDGNLSMIFANEEGARIINRHPALVLGRADRLKAARSDEDQALQRMLDDVLNGRIIVVGRDAPSMALRCDTRESPLKVSAVPLTASGLDPALANEGICLAVFVTDVERGIALPDSYLRATYGLTPAECSVAAGLINRATATDIAQQRGVEASTVRWQIKCLLQKTGTSTQADLVRLLSMLGSEFNLPV